jgi:hypothetical protein
LVTPSLAFFFIIIIILSFLLPLSFYACKSKINLDSIQL